jgi:transcriptional regulator GlxA family with amidase domain
LMIRSKLVECFVFLSRSYRRTSNNTILARETDKQSIEQIVRFIETHSEKQLTLSEICRLSGMGTSTFTAKFKAYTDRTFIDYRNEIRISNAKRLLVQSNNKMITIAHDVGFEDVSLFNRKFRELTGLSPSEYRKINK